MPVVAIINRKGGSGKSTLAAHLAVRWARQGLPVMLGDVDRQQSTRAWLRLREQQGAALDGCAPIVGWKLDAERVLRPPPGVAHVVLDTPGGLRGYELARVAQVADAILMPVPNSVFDRESAADCIAELKALPRVAGGRCALAAVGMRLDARTRAAEVLADWAAERELSFVGVLRETQAYVRCLEQGLTLFDLPESQTQADRAQWQPVLQWLDEAIAAVAVAPLVPGTAGAPAPSVAAGPAAARRPPPSGDAARQLAVLAARNERQAAQSGRGLLGWLPRWWPGRRPGALGTLSRL